MKRLLLSCAFFVSYPDSTATLPLPFLSVAKTPQSSSGHDSSTSASNLHRHYHTLARERLVNICGGNFQSVVVTGLKPLSQGPVWLKRAGGIWFCHILMSSEGLEAVLLAYLQGLLIVFRNYKLL